MDKNEAKRDWGFSDVLGYRTELTAYACSLLGNWAASEDAVPQAMPVVLKKVDEYLEGILLDFDHL